MDVSDAFYSIIRKQISSGLSLALVIDSTRQVFGLSQDEFEELQTKVRKAVHDTANGVLADSRPQPHVWDLLTAPATQAWYAVNGSTKAWLSEYGTPPGDPIGDLLFLHVVRSCLRKAESELSGLGIGFRIP
eukprot:3019656-Alexandrium_andersonii.AAC.1